MEENLSVTVTFAQAKSYDRGELRAALKKVLDPQLESCGGVAGRSVLLKPNLLAWKHPEDPTCVNPAFIVEL